MNNKEIMFALFENLNNESKFFEIAESYLKDKSTLDLYPRYASFMETAYSIIANFASLYYKDNEGKNLSSPEEQLLFDLITSKTNEEFRQIVLATGIDDLTSLILDVPIKISITEVMKVIITFAVKYFYCSEKNKKVSLSEYN